MLGFRAQILGSVACQWHQRPHSRPCSGAGKSCRAAFQGDTWLSVEHALSLKLFKFRADSFALVEADDA